MSRKKPKKEKRKIDGKSVDGYTVMAFNHENKVENYGLVGARSEPRTASDELVGGPPETHHFCGDTTYRCDRCLTDLKRRFYDNKSIVGVYYMLYAEDIDHKKRRIGILDGKILRKFCLSCNPFYEYKGTNCMFCGSKTDKAERVLEIVEEERRYEGEEADVRNNRTVGRICTKCAKKLSGKKNSLLKIFAKIAPPYSRPDCQKPTTHGIYSMAEAVNERNKLLKSMSKSMAKVAGKTRKKARR